MAVMRVIRRLFAIALVAAATAALWFAPAWLPSIGLGSAPSSSASPAPIWTVGKHSAEMVRDSRAANLQLVCPGAFVRSGGASGTKLGYFDRVAAPEIATTHWLRGAELRSTRLAGMADSAPEGNPVALEVSDPSGNLAQGSTLLSAASVQAASLVDFNGLLAAPCIAPATDSWLIGGSTQTGRESLLLLSNPGLADAQVSVSAFGPKGVIASSGLAAITVNAGQSVLVPLASDLPEAPTFALRVQSSSAPVAAWLPNAALLLFGWFLMYQKNRLPPSESPLDPQHIQ